MAENALSMVFAGKHLDLGGSRVHLAPFGGEGEHAAQDLKLAVDAGDLQAQVRRFEMKLPILSAAGSRMHGFPG